MKWLVGILEYRYEYFTIGFNKGPGPSTVPNNG